MTPIDPLSSDRAKRSEIVRSGQCVPSDRETGVGVPKKPRGATPSDHVTVSSDALLSSKIQQAIKDAPDVREDLVERVKSAVKNGSYQVNSREIAEALLKARELPSKPEGK